MSNKKIIMFITVLTLMVMSFVSSAFGAAARSRTQQTASTQTAAVAADTIGIVDMREVFNSHPGLEKAQQQLSTIARQKENEAKTAADKENDANKKAQAVQSKRIEFMREEQKLMAPIYRDCEQAVREVTVRKKLILVLDKNIVLIGGIDITQDVIQQLARKK